MSEKIGFIGLGIMGRGMVDNLIKAGFDLTVWNRTASRMDPFVERGASGADSPRAVAEASDITIICVSDTPDVEAVALGDDGVIHGASAGDLVIDMSTINPGQHGRDRQAAQRQRRPLCWTRPSAAAAKARPMARSAS